MAITPTQAQQLTPEQLARIAEEEIRIDQGLNGFDNGKQRLIEMPVGFTDRMYNELKSRYTAAGWNVVKTKTERGVDAWRFSIASASGCSAYDYYSR